MKHFINLKDISASDLRKILTDAKKRKKNRKKMTTLEVDKGSPLKGKLLIQMFEKLSLRTRLSFYLAIKQLGGGTLTLRSKELHINGLSPSSHPTQVLSDIFTIEEIKKKPISKLNIVWIGDCNNVLNSLIAASVKFNFKLNIGCPKNYAPKKHILDWVKTNNHKIHIFHDPRNATINADVLFSDKVVSLNDKVNKKKKLSHFKDFKITQKLISYAKKDCIFLHCLPRGSEVEEKIFSSKQSKVWLQALNRVHVQKSILLYCFEKLR